MAKNESEKFLSATIPGPRPGAFPIGSPQSRAAARIMLAGKNQDPQDRIRVIVRGVCQPVDFATSACRRTLSEDGSTLMEIVTLEGGEFSVQQLERFVNSFPIQRVGSGS